LLDLEDTQAYATPVRVDALMRDIWGAASALMILILALSSMLMHKRKRGWREEHLCDERVLVTPDAGPAVVGLLRSRK
jgi:hypothetical protein